MKNSKDGIEGINIFSWWVIITLLFLAGVYRSCRMENTNKWCEDLCKTRGEELKFYEPNAFGASCFCAEKKKDRLRYP